MVIMVHDAERVGKGQEHQVHFHDVGRIYHVPWVRLSFDDGRQPRQKLGIPFALQQEPTCSQRCRDPWGLLRSRFFGLGSEGFTP